MNAEQLETEREFDAMLATSDTAEILALRAENERLRAALVRVSEIYPTPYIRGICADALSLQP